MKTKMIFILLFLSTFLCGQAITSSVMKNEDGSWSLIRDGVPYYVKGVGSDSPKKYDVLNNIGANSVRTWGIGPNFQQFLDSAYQHGLSVMVGLWVQHESQGFDYDNEMAVANQKETFRQNVLTYKDHPAVLAWGIGNEVNLTGLTNKKVWNHINDVSEMIHEIDGNHFTSTILAGSAPGLLQDVKERAPDLDLIGVNMYGGISSVHNSIRNSGIDKPYMLTEWGINGPWEVGVSAWGTPYEVTSTEKASTYKNRYNNHILPNTDLCLGSYAFLWNTRLENDPIWFNMWVSGERTEVVDELQRAWTGMLPDNRSPKVLTTSLDGKVQSSNIVIKSLLNHKVKVFTNDPENDDLTYEFILRTIPKSPAMILQEGNTFAGIPGVIEYNGGNEAMLNFNVENNLTNFKLYCYVRDGNGNIGFSSMQFRTDFEVEDGENFYVVDQDSYIRDGAYKNSEMGSQDETNLEVKQSNTDGFSRSTLLSFDRTDHPTIYQSAKLRLFGKAPQEVEVEVSVSDSETSWNENQINWENNSQNHSTTLGTLTIDEELKYYEIDVTDYLASSITNKVSFNLSGYSSYSGDPATFYSKEKGANPPVLQYQISTATKDINVTPAIYPNPTSDYLKLSWISRDQIDQVAIYDVNGRLVKTFDSQERLRVSELESDNYILVFSNNKKLYSIQFHKL